MIQRHCTLNLADADDIKRVGGKAANLGHLIRAGFRVPPGFVVDTQAFRAADKSKSIRDVSASIVGPVVTNGERPATFGIPALIADDIRVAYRELGRGAVAVRSSATAEDLADASMAGQYETFLDVDGEDALLEAIGECWASFDSPRIHAYFREHKIDPADVAMAVVIQRLVPAEVAGVMFTTNPQPGRAKEMLIEASRGLGEAVVSGRVQPDVFRISRKSGELISASHPNITCLSEKMIHMLWQVGRQVAEHFESPQDIEWAIHGGEIYLLQSRPITTLRESQVYDDLMQGTQQRLRDEVSPARGPWVLHNLAETLPQPTPLTWSLIRRYMSGDGAMGAAYRRVGFEPSAAVCRNGFLDLIAGRVYMDVSRSPQMFSERFPFTYDVDDLKSRPDAGQAPPTVPCGTLLERLRVARQLATVGQRLRNLATNKPNSLTATHFPAMEKFVQAARQVNLASLSTDQLIDAWRERCGAVLDDFGAESIVASMIASHALDDLRTFIRDHFWQDDPQAVAEQLAAGGAATRTLLADSELRRVGMGDMALNTWLRAHGHRGTNEFDLSAPRWSEQPDNLQKLADTLARGACPLDRHAKTADASNRLSQSLEARLSKVWCTQFEQRVMQARRYITLREDAKDCLMLGYELLRELALEIGRRLDIGDDVFFLKENEMLASLVSRQVPRTRIEERKQIRRAEKQLSLPTFINAKIVETLGEVQELKLPPGGMAALPLSAGAAGGPARILHSPVDASNLAPGYILVCPSTDPSWTPLFTSAAGLVLQCGGSLSHGAIVAREMGLPAVVLPGATQMFAEGETIQVDGSRGWVARPSESPSQSQPNISDADDTRIPADSIPPRPGYKDRVAAKLRNICTAIWAIFLIGFFLLPKSMIRAPTLAAIDSFLWPVVRSAGKPATVAIVAAILAILALLVQRFVTDNSRLREAKRRARLLRREAKSLPLNSPRRRVIRRLLSEVQMHSLFTSLVPIGILLGPMAIPFVWFSERLDPSVTNAAAGDAINVVALVQGDWPSEVQLVVPSILALDETTPSIRAPAPIRQTLERLLTLMEQTPRGEYQPWELEGISSAMRQQAREDLKGFLATGIAPRGITWVLRSAPTTTGKLTILLNSGKAAPITADVVIGEDTPPTPTLTRGLPGSPLLQLQIIYQKPKIAPFFWQPFYKFADTTFLPKSVVNRLVALDVSWLWVYLIAYIPMLFFARRILSVA